MKIKLYSTVAVLVLLPAPAAAVASMVDGAAAASRTSPPTLSGEFGPGNAFSHDSEIRLDEATVAQRIATSGSSLRAVEAGPVLGGVRLPTPDHPVGVAH